MIKRLHGLWVGHFAGNLGDSAAFDVIDRAIPESVEFTIQAYSVIPFRKRTATRLIDHNDKAAVASAIQAADACILAGTTIFSGLHDGNWPIDAVLEQLRYCRELAKPVHAIGVGVYPHGNGSQRARLRELAELVETFTVRDRTSCEAMLNAGAGPNRVNLAADAAWLLDRPIDLERARWEVKSLTGGRDAIAINVVHEDWEERGEFYESLANELDEYARLTGRMPLFLANEVRLGTRYDQAAAENVARRMKTASAILSSRWMHPEEMIARIACCQTAISMRYHFSVFAAMAGVPVISFRRGGKLDSLLEDLSHHSAGPIGEPTQGRLLQSLLEIDAGRTNLLDQLKHYRQDLTKRAGQIMNLVKPELSGQPATGDLSPRSILITRLDALGDTVLCLPLIQGLLERYPKATVQLVVRPQMIGVRKILPPRVQLYTLPFDPREPVGENAETIAHQLKDLAGSLKPDWAICGEYNRVWASQILIAWSGANRCLAFNGPSDITYAQRAVLQHTQSAAAFDWETISVDGASHETEKYRAMLKALGCDDKLSMPELVLSPEAIARAEAIWKEAGLRPEATVLIFPGSGSGQERSLPVETWHQCISHLKDKGSSLALLGSEFDDAMIRAVATERFSELKRLRIATEDVDVLAAVLGRAKGYIGADTGPMHVAAVQGILTLGIFGGGHRAHRFLPIGAQAAAVRMPLSCYGCDWRCPFDSRLCISRMPAEGLIKTIDTFLKGISNNDPLRAYIFDLEAPSELQTPLLGASMRNHYAYLKLSHEVAEHHQYLADSAREAATQLSHRNDQNAQVLAGIMKTLTEMTLQNQKRDEAISHLSQAITEMTKQNQDRDHAIAHNNRMLEEMTRQNQNRDKAIEHITVTLATMTQQNQGRDQAINHINDVLAELARQNQNRDQAIADLTQMIEDLKSPVEALEKTTDLQTAEKHAL